MFWRKKKRKQNEAALQEALAAMEHTASLDPFVKAVLGGQAEILRVMPKLEALKAKIATTSEEMQGTKSRIIEGYLANSGDLKTKISAFYPAGTEKNEDGLVPVTVIVKKKEGEE